MKFKMKQNISLLKYQHFLANKVIKLRITMNIKQIVFLLHFSLVRHSILYIKCIINRYLSLILQLNQFRFLYMYKRKINV